MIPDRIDASIDQVNAFATGIVLISDQNVPFERGNDAIADHIDSISDHIALIKPGITSPISAVDPIERGIAPATCPSGLIC